MSLTDGELQKIRDIERRLTLNDPSFARRMTGAMRGLHPLRPPSRRSRKLMWIAVAMAAYVVSALLLVLAVAGTVSVAAMGCCLALDTLVPLCVLVASRRPRSAAGRPRRRTPPPPSPLRAWRRRSRPG